MNNIFILDGQTDKVLDHINKKHVLFNEHEQSLENTLETFHFRALGDMRYAEHLGKRNSLIVPGEDGELLEFRIFESEKYRDSEGLKVEVYALATYLDLKTQKIFDPHKTNPETAQAHANLALEGTEWSVGNVDYKGIRTLEFDSPFNPYEYLKRIAHEFDLELRFYVTTDGQKVTGRYVDLVERVGEFRGRTVEFGRDLQRIRRKEDTREVVTALWVYGPEREDGSRLKVFVEDDEARQRWGRKGKHIIDYYEPQTENQDITEERLRTLGEMELRKRINAVVTYEAEIIDLENVPGLENKKIRFGDTIRIKDTKFNPPLYVEARVFNVKRDVFDRSKKTMQLGDYREYTEDEVKAIWNQLRQQIQQKISAVQAEQMIEEYAEPKKVESPTPPPIDPEGDNPIWIDTSKDPHVPHIVEQGQWVKISPTEANEVGAETPKGAQEKADTAEQNAKTYADSVAEQKKQEAINAAIADAETKINTAKMELEADIALKADAEWVNGQLVLKENAITKSNTAPSNPTTGQLWLDTSVTPNVLKRWDGSAWVKATPTSAGEVGAYTKTEVDNALNSKVSVTQYTTDMNGVITRLDSAESRITQTENEIATKVSNTTYQQDKAAIESDISALESRVTNAETNITQNANQIALKANKTDVYTKTEIDSQFSTVNQQISQLDAELSVQADQIATKVSRTEFESLQIGGRNLLRNSHFDGLDYWAGNQTATLTIENGYLKVIFGQSQSTPGLRYIPQVTLEKGFYTASAKVNVENLSQPLTFYVLPRYRGTQVLKGGETGWRIITWTFEVTADQDTGTFYLLSSGTSSTDYMLVEWIKLEKGNKATDWTRADEDVQGQIDGLGTRVTNAETSITQLSNQIQLKANQSTVDTLTNRVSQAESSITLLSDEIQLKVDKDGVISAINLSPETAKLQASKIELDGYVEAKHIKSLNGLNVNDQFIVDSNGNVKFAGHLEGASGTFGKVSVVDGDMTLIDNTTGSETILNTGSNFLFDHSFEFIKPNVALEPVDPNNPYLASICSVDADSLTSYYGGWNNTKPSNARMVRAFDAESKHIYSGLNAIILRGQDYGIWEQICFIPEHVRQTNALSFSAYVAPFEKTTYDVSVSLRIQLVNENGQWIQDLASTSYLIDHTKKYNWQRVSVTYKGNLNIGKNRLRVRLLLNNNTSNAMLLCDGAQLVPFKNPTLYEPESSLFHFLNGIGKANLISTQHIASDFADVHNLWAGRLTAANSVIIESSSYSYLRPDNPNNELRVANSSGQWSTVRAYTASPSSERWKSDIKDVDFSAIEVLKRSKIYSYIREGKKEREIGFIIERETPDMLKDGEGINSYTHSSLNTLAIQELIARVENIEERLGLHESRHK